MKKLRMESLAKLKSNFGPYLAQRGNIWVEFSGLEARAFYALMCMPMDSLNNLFQGDIAILSG